MIRLCLLGCATLLLVACGGSPALPPELCKPCGVDADCGASANRCLDIGGTAACGTDCSVSSCPDGFVCASVTGGGRNCIPASGRCPPPCGGCPSGLVCDPGTNTCIAPPDAGSNDASPDGSQADAGRPHVGPWPVADGDILDLGNVGDLIFTTTGDCQPDEANGPYPTALATRVMEQMSAQSPDFGVFLGDSMDVYPANYAIAVQQLTQFLSARDRFAPELYFVLGNHEDWGANLQAYRDLMTASHYYALRMQTSRGEAQIVVLADSRWEPNYQKPWAEAQLARSVAYTFVAHHYPSWSSEEPTSGDLPATLGRYHVTLEMAGHHHRYDFRDRTVTVGIACAPLANSGEHHGFLRVEILADGKVRGTTYREDTGQVMDTFTVAP